ncbi:MULTISPECIES: hypothetical protein [unclassified Mesorhizobium]|uniref:phage tail tube protein n=1 Tax=unclassified Mesorhizobium TaxID=325217 RepID=UPI001093B201|nr:MULTISPECIES: hypothetical protein [unclassified Mesorhizobium]TGT90922.1 hypothetical protein EN804_06190 [Mesorhizobium sp. M8A.F.Ca.ET.161.01.1.1]TGV43798.1 hypothetical protein EN785_07355 [Mesorhizobium sp. M8A.F.Ca.ET.142.01.1.1]
MDTQSRNLVVPRGKAFFARYLAGTQTPGPLRELGNCPELTLTAASTTLKNYGSQAGLQVLDAEIPITTALNGAIRTNDMRPENVSYWFMGAVGTVTATALTDQSETYLLVKAGDTFQLGRTDSNPTGARKLTNVEVTDGAPVTPTPLVLGTDYELDAELGLVTALVDAAKWVVGFDTLVSTRQQIASTVSLVEGELKFISFNAAGEQADITLPRVSIAPNGDLALVNDPESPAWQTMGLTVTALKKGNLALAYRDGRPAA